MSKSNELFGKETIFARCDSKPVQRIQRILKNPLQWEYTNNVIHTPKTAKNYVLISKESSQEETTKKQTKSRFPVCYSVVQELPSQEFKNILPMIKGIRISICVEHTRFPLVGKVAKTMGLTHVPEHRLWNIQWCDSTPHFDLLKAMKRFQQINHFPGMTEICRKDMLALNLNRMLKLYPGDYRIFPKTWLIPSDAYDVSVYSTKHKRTYILKPYSSGQGRGIWITNNLRSVGKKDKLICQTYIDRPLLIDGFKFDLRVYTLITSVDPLRIFVYNEGLARFATNKYMPPALGNSNNVFMHLTNYSVNRRNSNYNAGTGTEGGSKRKFSEYNKWLEEHNYDVPMFWAAVDDVIVKTVISARPVLRHNYHACFPKHDKIQACFQLLGFDILVDWKLKPFVLEVNHTPSLCGDETVDNEVKRPLIRDTLNLLSSQLVDKEEIIREDRVAFKERLYGQQGKKRVPRTTQGAATPRVGQTGGANELSQTSSLAQQVAWEEAHMGNYRRVMPPADPQMCEYYEKFLDERKKKEAPPPSKIYLKNSSALLKGKKLRKQLDPQIGAPDLEWDEENLGDSKTKAKQNLGKSRKLRKIQEESRQDAEFLQQHGIKCKSTVEIERVDQKDLQGNGKSTRKAKQIKINQLTCKEFSKGEISGDPKNQRNRKISKVKGSDKWLPISLIPIEEVWQKDWQQRRLDTETHWQLKQMLFKEMFELGHLSKSDIKMFPYLLFRILKQKLVTVNMQKECGQNC